METLIKHARAVLIGIALLAIPAAASSARAKPSAGRRPARHPPAPAIADASLQAVLDAIDKAQPLDGRRVGRMLGGLGRSEAMLSREQADRVWSHYERVGAKLDAAAKRGSRTSRPTYRNASGAMTQVKLYWGLIRRMQPQHVRAVRAADFFPGKVPKDAKTVSRTITVHAATTRWHSTGLYAAPGAAITVTVPKEFIDKALAVQIGCHNDYLGRKQSTARWPAIVVAGRIQSVRTQIANPLGGLVYIVVPNDADPSWSVKAAIDGAVESPRFVLGKTSPAEWKSRIRLLPGPWAEFESDKLVATVPASKVRTIDDPTKVVAFWKRVADAQDDLSGRKRPRYKERMVCDVQISAGALHAGYPLMGHLYNAEDLVNYEKVSSRGTWGWFHELGHNHQRPPWRHPIEVTVNIFSMYTMETVVGLKTHEVGWYKKCIPAVKKFYADGLPDGRAAWTHGYALPLAMYMHMRKDFGWDFYKKVFREYERMGPDKWPRAQQDRRDLWLVITSKAAGRDLSPFYDRWGLATTKKARAQVASLPKWNPTEYQGTKK